MSQLSAATSGRGRDLVEYAVKQLLESAPAGWTHLHAECVLPGVVTAWVADARGSSRWVPVPPEASRALIQHRLAEAGLDSLKLVVDCGADGRLSAVLQPEDGYTPGRAERQWPRRTLLTVTAACLVAAAAVFAFGWRWSAPPIADAELLPPLPARQQQAFDLVNQWFAALNTHDGATVEALRCSNPTGAVLNDVEALQGDYLGGIDHPEALVDFRDRGANVAAKIVFRTKPLTVLSKQAVAANQKPDDSGLSHRWIVLVEEGGALKVCGSE